MARRRILDLIENPTDAEEQQILQMRADGATNADIVRRTGFSLNTVKRVFRKHRAKAPARAGVAVEEEVVKKVLEAADVPGMTPTRLSQLTDVPKRTVERILREHRKTLAISATVARRIEEQVEEKVAPGEVISREVRLEIAKAEVEFYWAVAATKLLLLPARDIPQADRLKAIQRQLSEGEKAVRTAGGRGAAMTGAVIIDGRDMIKELREIASFVMLMVLGAEPKEYSKRFKRGGVEAMLKYGEKVAAKEQKGLEHPLDKQAVADFLSLAVMHAETPGATRGPTAGELAEEYDSTAAIRAERRGEARAEGEFRKELMALGKLKRLRGDPEAFLAKVREQLEEADNLPPGPLRRLKKVEIRKVAREVVPPKLWESHGRLKAYAMTQKLRDDTRDVMIASGIKRPTQKQIDQVLLAMDIDWSKWPGRAPPIGWPRTKKPKLPRAAILPPAWVEWMQKLLSGEGEGVTLPPEEYAAAMAPIMGLAVPSEEEAVPLALAEREMETVETWELSPKGRPRKVKRKKPRFTVRRERAIQVARELAIPFPKPRKRPKRATPKKLQEIRAAEVADREEWRTEFGRAMQARLAVAELPAREAEARSRAAAQAAMVAQTEEWEREVYDLLESDLPAEVPEDDAEAAAAIARAAAKVTRQLGRRVSAQNAARILNKYRAILGIKKPKAKAPKAESGLWAIVYSLLLAKATPQEIEEFTGFDFPEDSGEHLERDKITGRLKHVYKTGTKEIRRRMRGKVTKEFQSEIKDRLKLQRKLKEEREKRAIERAAMLAEIEEAKEAKDTERLREALAKFQQVEMERRERFANPYEGPSWANRLYYRVNAALVLGAPLARRGTGRKKRSSRRATRRNPDRSSALRRMMRL